MINNNNKQIFKTIYKLKNKNKNFVFLNFFLYKQSVLSFCHLFKCVSFTKIFVIILLSFKCVSFTNNRKQKFREVAISIEIEKGSKWDLNKNVM